MKEKNSNVGLWFMFISLGLFYIGVIYHQDSLILLAFTIIAAMSAGTMDGYRNLKNKLIKLKAIKK